METGAAPMTSGNRNVRKRNPKRIASFEQQLAAVKYALDELKKKYRKTLEDKAEIANLETRKKHLSKKQKQKSEPHSRRGERH